jgi:DNA-binding MarR family transcriptional regulator
MNDRELAEKLKLNISTLTAIKNRLKKRDYFFTRRIPLLQNVGCELISVGLAKLNILMSPENRQKMEKEFVEKYPETFLMMNEADYLLCISIAENFTEMQKVIEDIKTTANKYEALDEQEFSNFFFPFQTSQVLNFFDFSQLLQRTFNIKEDEKRELKPAKISAEPKKLSRIEKIVYYGLIKYPDLPDKKIAEYTNVTRQVVARLRKEFENENLIKTVRIPNLKKLDFQIIACAYAVINNDAVKTIRKKGVGMVMQNIPVIFWVSGKYEVFILAAMKNYDDYKDLYLKGFSFFKKYNYFRETPLPQTLSVNYVNYLKNHDYAPLVKKIFEITEID